MILFVGFPNDEQSLLTKAAEKLDVLSLCKFISEIGSLNEKGDIVNMEAISAEYPSVIFLNLDANTEHWRVSLERLKEHPKLKGLPVVGLGRIENDKINELYEHRINSYIRKPDTFEKMLDAADTALKFWLHVSLVPNKIISES